MFHVKESLLDDAQEAADDYEKVLIKGFANKDSVKLPMFDLLLLGCAPDGHICSLFPSHPLLREEYAWVAPIEDAPKPPPRRITLTLPVIYHSHRVTFVVEGSTKAPVLKTIMERPEKGLPSSLVNEAAAGKVSWFVDDEALTGVFVTKKEYKIQVPLNGTSSSSATTPIGSTNGSTVASPIPASSPIFIQKPTTTTTTTDTLNSNDKERPSSSSSIKRDNLSKPQSSSSSTSGSITQDQIKQSTS